MALAGTNLALLKGIRNTFRNIYKAHVIKPHSYLGRLMGLGWPSDGAYEDYFHYLSVSNPRRRAPGQSRPRSGLTGVGKRTVNHDWEDSIEWHENQRADDQTKGLWGRARELGKKFAFIPQRVFFQLLTGATDADLLPNTPLATDGVGLFSTVDGAGNPRFGAPSGNLLTVGTMSTGADLRDGVYQGLEQFQLFEDTSGEQLFNDGEVHEKVIFLIHGAHRTQGIQEGFEGKFVAHEAKSGGNVVGAAGISNVILDAGWKIITWGSKKITDNSLYLAMEATSEEECLMYQQLRQPLRDDVFNRSNSDRARDEGMEGIGWKCRAGYDINPRPYRACKIQE